MLEIIREYSFDVNFETGKFKRTDGSTERIKLVQNDNESTKFKFNFEEEIADNTNVLVRLRQSTGYVKEYTMLIQNQEAELILANDILSASGSIKMSITLIGTNNEILTAIEYFEKIEVKKCLEGNTEIPEQEKNVLVDLISQVNSLNQTASQLVEDTETAVTNSSTVLANAETALQNANTATSNANQAAESANNAVTELDNRLANKVDIVSGKSLSTNDFTNEYKQKLENLENYDDSEILQELNNKADINDIPDTSDFINNTVNNLLNYYLKNETYSKTEVNNLIGQIATLRFQVVNELPVTGNSSYIYLVPSSNPKTQNIKDEYIWVNSAWEQIGSTQVNLRGYATESWVNLQISNYLTQSQIQTLINTSLSEYVQDGNYVHTDNNYTTEEKTKLASLENYNDTQITELIENLEEENETLYNDHPDITATGTNVTLNGTGDFKMKVSIGGNNTQGDLPNEYQEVEYIESSGTQYIDTEFIPDYTNGYQIEVDFAPNKLGYRYSILSGYDVQNALCLEITNSNQGRIYCYNGAVGKYIGTVTTQKNTFRVKFKNSIFTYSVNGSSNSTSYSSAATVNESLYMFMDRQLRYSTFPQPLKIYTCKLYNNDVLVRNFIPCYRKSDNEIGLYDLVSNTFFTNAGTGNFAKGSDIYPTINSSKEIKIVDGEYQIEITNSDNTLSQSAIVDTSTNPLYSQEDYYYKNNGEWYAYNEYIKITLTSNLNWETSNNGNWYFFNDMRQNLAKDANSNVYSNYFNKGNWSVTPGENIICLGNGYDGMVGISTTTFATVNDLKTFLDNNNVYAIVKLRTPTIIKITNINLINSLEILSNMKSYYNMTNINQTHENEQCDANIIVNAKKSLKVMQNQIDNIESRLSLLE